jgi:LPXTG-site transpeptidase (sortase) family protein
MIRFVKSNIVVIAVGCAAILIGCLLFAIFSPFKGKPEKEDVPTGRIHDAGVFGEDIEAHDSGNGVNIIGAALLDDESDRIPLAAPQRVVSDPADVWTVDAFTGNHTYAEKALMDNGSIGVLTIPTLLLSVNVYESQDPDNMEAMDKGVAHFPSTSAFDGNVGLSAHNINLDGSDGYFKNLYTLRKGDIITYQTALGVRNYTVSSITTIDASDWTPLSYSDDHRLTMITCISGQPNKRLSVQAILADL